MNKAIFLVIAVLILFLNENIFSQNPNLFKCGTPESYYNAPLIGNGQYKPVKTLPENDTSVYLRCLVVFVEFANDYSYSNSEHWPPQQSGPDYMDDIFAGTKNLSGYTDYSLSDYWDEISHGEFDVIADVKHIILPYDASHYSSYSQLHTDVYRMLDTNQTYRVDWRRYDKWRWNNSTQQYENIGDDYIDMMIIQHRKVDLFGALYGGFAGLNAYYSTINYGKYIDGGWTSHEASGFTGIDGALLNLGNFMGLFIHEYAHFSVLMAHRPYSKVSGDEGSNTENGGDFAFSPQDLFVTGLDMTTLVDFNTSDYSIGDMLSTGELIKVPISSEASPSEYYYICNRRKVSLYDIIMQGDTTMCQLFAPAGDYGKGVYIYHITNGTDYNWFPDLEAADGLYNWEYLYNTTPDWSTEQLLPVVRKSGVSYNEDDPTSPRNSTVRMSNRDGLSLVCEIFGVGGYERKWFSTGKRHESLYQPGLDRIFTNLEEDWCSRECAGDRWDAWNRYYNEVFSPYSSPSTNSRQNSSTGIFIYYSGLSGTTASFKIYKVGEGGYTEDEILELTPPSRPMGLALTMSSCTDQKAFPVLSWNHNMEPDMATNSSPAYKRYLIFRAIEDIRNVPDAYSQIADVYIGINEQPIYVDSNAYAQCDLGGIPTYNYQLRYKIKAVDTYSDSSVFSNFIAIPVYLWQSGEGGDYFVINNHPMQFSLSQNYPNPFNPTTSIRYSIPKQSLVKLVIYDMIGREVTTLVNEMRQAGNYEANFDASNLASGAYFYRIEAGDFTDVKKMVLIK